MVEPRFRLDTEGSKGRGLADWERVAGLGLEVPIKVTC